MVGTHQHFWCLMQLTGQSAPVIVFCKFSSSATWSWPGLNGPWSLGTMMTVIVTSYILSEFAHIFVKGNLQDNLHHCYCLTQEINTTLYIHPVHTACTHIHTLHIILHTIDTHMHTCTHTIRTIYNTTYTHSHTYVNTSHIHSHTRMRTHARTHAHTRTT